MSLLGCSTPAAEPTPKFDPGAPEPKNESTAYPAGPYGKGEGSIVENLSFIGYVNPVANTATMQRLQFADFYNPHAGDPTYKPASPAEDDRLFPPGSQYGEGTKKPTVIAFDMAAMWCPPCNEESRCVTPVREHRYTACGGGFFLELDQDVKGNPAVPKNLFTWAAKEYPAHFPVAIDPGDRIIRDYADQGAFPQNYIIDTRTMKIVAKRAGVPDAKYWATYESLLEDPSCPSKQSQCASDADCTTDFPGTTCSLTCPPDAFTCIAKSCQKSGCKNQ